MEAHQFDVVFLDPPRYAKSAFGVVDLIPDYAALFKPALLSTLEGGTFICWQTTSPGVAAKVGWICSNAARAKPDAGLTALNGLNLKPISRAAMDKLRSRWSCCGLIRAY